VVGQLTPGELTLNAKPIVEAIRSQLGGEVNAAAITPPVYVPAEKLTEAAACDWMANALVGQSIQYHEGFLMIDRSNACSELTAKERNRLHAVARRMWIACEMGLVHLCSVKVGDCHYRYIAVRSATKLTSPEIRARLGKAGAPSNTIASATQH
jgi:hypothetical protein